MGRVKIVRRRFDRRVKKKCPECEKEIPVACKTCPICRHQFTNTKLKLPQAEEDVEVLPVKRRRTKRTQRERPDFFNSLELDKQFKKKRRRKESTTSVTSPTTPTAKPSLDGGDLPAKKRRGRPKSISQNDSEKDVGPPPDEDMFASLPPEKYLQYTIILAEVNRKFSTQNFKPS